MPRDYAVIGAGGEHLVLSRLLSRGIIAAKVPERTAKVDIAIHLSEFLFFCWAFDQTPLAAQKISADFANKM